MIFILFKDVNKKKEKKKDIEYNPPIFDEMVPVFCFCFISFPWHPVYFHPILTVKFRFMIGLSTKSINSSKKRFIEKG